MLIQSNAGQFHADSFVFVSKCTVGDVRRSSGSLNLPQKSASEKSLYNTGLYYYFFIYDFNLRVSGCMSVSLYQLCDCAVLGAPCLSPTVGWKWLQHHSDPESARAVFIMVDW